METRASQEQPRALRAVTEDVSRRDAQGGESIPVLNVGDPEFLGGAYEAYEALREKGPVVRVAIPVSTGSDEEENPEGRTAFQEIYGKEVFFLSRYAEVFEALRDERFSSCPHALKSAEELAEEPVVAEELKPLRDSLLTTDAPDHTRLRKLVQPSFTAQAMEALRPRIVQLAQGLLDQAEAAAAARGEKAGERRMDLVEAFAYPLPVTVISELLGIPEADRDRVRHWTEDLLINRGSRGLDKAALGKLQEFSTYLRALFVERRDRPAEDLISRMVHAKEEGDALSEDELLSMVFLIYVAGHVTTVNLIGNGVFALLTHPEQLERFKASPSLSRGVVEETLRFWGPVDTVSGRIAKEDVEIAGTVIPKGSRVMCGLAAASHDPARFDHPEAFDITRPDAGRHVAFGRGIHLCLGAPLARLEGQIAFEVLFDRFPSLRLSRPAEEMSWGHKVLRGFDEIPVLF
ncbi:cytochrome P450 family protein [Chondromyces crocatus]|uniref:Cytochrome P450 n=1 Tax=Chondromyces crocatus TaxID=52 RepID=A0A0K1EJ42_CHOCO|nr:cytochrome P450 [Chondromyces crocatus]AKT40687.1 cytochrome P450 [Chondromyces crocatus]